MEFLSAEVRNNSSLQWIFIFESMCMWIAAHQAIAYIRIKTKRNKKNWI